MFCPNCGEKVPESAFVCGNCGHRLKDAPPPKADQSSKAESPPQAETAQSQNVASQESLDPSKTAGSNFLSGIKNKPWLILTLGLVALAIIFFASRGNSPNNEQPIADNRESTNVQSPTQQVASADPSDQFAGLWDSTDSDGSKQELDIETLTNNLKVTIVDFGASICGEFDAGVPTVEASGEGIGHVEGQTLSVPDLQLFCHHTDGRGKIQVEGEFPVTFEAQGNGTIVSGDGLIWHRR